MPPFSYRAAAPSVKLAVTGFLLLCVVGLGVAALQIYVRTGMTSEGALLHYRGSEATLQYPKSFSEMVEITHAHAFTMPFLVLLLSVAMAASAAREWIKSAVIAALLSGIALELGVPWLIRYGPAWAVHLLPLTGFLLGGGLLIAVSVPLHEMWMGQVLIHL